MLHHLPQDTKALFFPELHCFVSSSFRVEYFHDTQYSISRIGSTNEISPLIKEGSLVFFFVQQRAESILYMIRTSPASLSSTSADVLTSTETQTPWHLPNQPLLHLRPATRISESLVAPTRIRMAVSPAT
jgi:hypothetical protein